MFQEYTCIVIDDTAQYTTEVYLHFNEQGKLVCAYCYADDIPQFPATDNIGEIKYDRFGDYKYVNLRIKASRNSLFIHLSPAQISKYLNHFILLEALDDDETIHDPILQKALTNYPQLKY